VARPEALDGRQAGRRITADIDDVKVGRAVADGFDDADGHAAGA
jgi:hypothetical protein